MVTFPYVRMGTDLAYTVTLEDYETFSGTVTVGDDDVKEEVVLTALPTYTVTFTVTDGTNPIEGAEVTFNGATGTTNASGVYAATELLPATDMPYTVAKAAYESVNGTVTIVDADVNVDVTINLIAYNVTFNVTDGAAAIEGAEIAFNGATGTTDASGTYTFAAVVPAADMAYTITKAAYENATGTVSVVDQDVNVNATMTRNAFNVAFNVTDGSNPVEGAEIAFNGTTGTTDAAGTYTFALVSPAADMAYTITKAAYDDVSGSVTVVDADVTVNETMSLTVYTVTFNVTDGTDPLEGATVSFNSEDIATDATGKAVFNDVLPGTGLPYSVTLDYRYYDASGTVDVDGDETVDVIMALTSVNNAMLNTINVYPNPTTGKVNIVGVTSGATYEIYNISSQKIAAGILESGQIDLNSQAGLYILKITSDEHTYIQRIVVE